MNLPQRSQYIILFFIFLFFGSSLQDGILTRIESPRPSPLSAPSPSISHSPVALPQIQEKRSLPEQMRTPLLSKKLIFAEIDKNVKNHRKQFAFCLLQNKAFYATRIQMTLHWQGSGLLKDIRLSPDPGSEVKACFQEVIHRWNLKSHPGMQPFSFQSVLILAN